MKGSKGAKSRKIERSKGEMMEESKGHEEAATEDLLVQAERTQSICEEERKGTKEEELVINDRDLFCFKVDE